MVSGASEMDDGLSMNTTKVGYRSDIDVLRAVAVIAVMLYHFKIGIFLGGVRRGRYIFRH